MISLSEIQPSGTDLVSQVEEIFSPTGILSRAKNFEFRPQQQEMAVAVARTLQNREHLAVEAGTGVGKSLAYLIPAILFAIAQKKKAIICFLVCDIPTMGDKNRFYTAISVMAYRFYWSKKMAYGACKISLCT